MKTLKSVASVLALSFLLGTGIPANAQAIKDTSSTTKPNGSGAGNGVSQGAPGAATVSGTGTGTLADSNSIASGDSGVKKSTAISSPGTTTGSTETHSNWGLFGLLGLLGLLGLRKNNDSRAS